LPCHSERSEESLQEKTKLIISYHTIEHIIYDQILKMCIKILS
jgi:hypothetical protein